MRQCLFQLYLYNPRVVNAAGYQAGSSKDPATLRLMQKQNQARHKLFHDGFRAATRHFRRPDFQPKFLCSFFPQERFSVLFADGAAKFISSKGALSIVLSGSFSTQQSVQSCTDYDKLL